MAQSLRSDRLKRYSNVARLPYNYGRTDLVSRAGLGRALSDELTFTTRDRAARR